MSARKKPARVGASARGAGGSGEWGARIALAVCGTLPAAVRRSLFVALARLFYHLVPRQRLIALHNLRRAFPDKGMDEIVAIARGVYRTIGIVAADFFAIPGLTPARAAALIDVEGLDKYERALDKGKGILMFGAHFGNWELMAAVAAIFLRPVMAVYRPLDNALLDVLVNRVRSATGNVTQPKEGAVRPMLRFLRNGGIIGLLIDQNVAWYEGVFVDFFGRQACTTDGLALLAQLTGAPVLPVFLVRDGRRYRLIIEDEVPLVQTGDRRADAWTNTQSYTRIIEEMVRRYPDQWLWVHQRWKTRPSQVRARRSAAAAAPTVPGKVGSRIPPAPL